MKFGKINNFLLFGGGDLLLKIALYLKSYNNKVCVITSERHFSENLLFNICIDEYLSKFINLFFK